jgi:hypothetical protein
MARPEMPKIVAEPNIPSFRFEKATKGKISKIIDRALTDEHAEAIEYATACFLATKAGSRSTTLENTAYSLRQLLTNEETSREWIDLLVHERSGLDVDTIVLLRPLAEEILAGSATAEACLMLVARRRLSELEALRRIHPPHEALRLFCIYLSAIFSNIATPARTDGGAAFSRRRRKFARVILEAAGVDCLAYEVNPRRLTVLLNSDVTLPEGNSSDMYFQCWDRRAHS